MIDHISPSSVNLWISSPALWYMRYVAKVRTSSPLAWRGKAVERALVQAWENDLAADEAIEEAVKTFKLEGGSSVQVAPERLEESFEVESEIPDTISAGLQFFRDQISQRGGISYTQLKVEIDSLPIKAIGYADIVTGDGTVIDIKTVKQMPSSIDTVSRDHIRQLALYLRAGGNRAALMYFSRPPKGSRATHGGHKIFEIPGELLAEEWRNFQVAAQSIKNAISLGGEVLRSIISPDYEDYRWDSILKEEGKRIWTV